MPDIVLQHVRKRLSAEEMRAEHIKVFDGMIAASRARAAGHLEDTGSTAVAFDGEEGANTELMCLSAHLLISTLRPTARHQWTGTAAMWAGFTQRGAEIVKLE